MRAASSPISARAKAGAAVAAGGGIDFVRDGLSVLFTTLIYTGYALILVAAMALAEDRGFRVAVRQGLLWGLAGFVAVQFAPAVGLPPELPGSAAADMGLRQAWWFGTVGATAAGIALIAFGKGWTARGIAAALILAPHVVGAPHPETFAGPVPPELAGMFAGRGARRRARRLGPARAARCLVLDPRGQAGGGHPAHRLIDDAALSRAPPDRPAAGRRNRVLSCGGEQRRPGRTHHHPAAEDAGHGGTIDLPAGPDAPTLDFRVAKDAGAGWNLHVATTGFRFAPERVNAPHRPGEGHAHVYVDGKKVARIYGPWFHLGALAAGQGDALRHSQRQTTTARWRSRDAR